MRTGRGFQHRGQRQVAGAIRAPQRPGHAQAVGLPGLGTLLRLLQFRFGGFGRLLELGQRGRGQRGCQQQGQQESDAHARLHFCGDHASISATPT